MFRPVAVPRTKPCKNLKAAVRLFLEEAEKMGTLEQILEEAGYSKTRQKLAGPQFVSVQRLSFPLPLSMPKFSPVHYKQLVKVFEADGFRLAREEGDHMIFTKLRPESSGR